MNPKRILVALTLALFVSGLSTWVVSRKMTASPTAQRPIDITYAAPSHDLQAGEVLSVENTELVAWPGSVPIDGAFPRIADVMGREVLFPLARTQPILDRDLSAAGSGTGLASKIPNGMRAVALRSDDIIGVAGFVVPGSHLDVLVTYRSDRVNEPLTATVLQNAVVIAAGHQIEPLHEPRDFRRQHEEGVRGNRTQRQHRKHQNRELEGTHLFGFRTGG